MFLIFDFKTCNASEVLSTSGSIARPIDVIYKFVIGTMAVIKNKTHAALVDPLKFVTVSLAAIMSNNWAVVEAREKKGIMQAFLSTSRNKMFMAQNLSICLYKQKSNLSLRITLTLMTDYQV